MLIELLEKFKDNLIMYAPFVSATFIYLLEIFVLFPLRILLGIFSRIFMHTLSSVRLPSIKSYKIFTISQFDKNFQNTYSRN